MRLFLSSYRAGQHEQDFLKLADGKTEMAYISNSKDYKTPQDRKAKIEENFDYWTSLGFKPREVDLRPFFHKPGAEQLLDDFELIWLSGGNVFLLRRALLYTGLDKVLSERARQNKIILAGESAGAIIMGPTLKHSEVETDNEDSPYFVPTPYSKEIIWEGLGLTDYVPVPHYQTPGYIGIDEYIKNLEKDKILHKKMTDDQAIIIDGDKQELLK